jgi:hypothetical protein
MNEVFPLKYRSFKPQVQTPGIPRFRPATCPFMSNKNKWWWRAERRFITRHQQPWKETKWTLSPSSAIFGMQTWALDRQRIGARYFSVCIIDETVLVQLWPGWSLSQSWFGRGSREVVIHHHLRGAICSLAQERNCPEEVLLFPFLGQFSPSVQVRMLLMISHILTSLQGDCKENGLKQRQIQKWRQEC